VGRHGLRFILAVLLSRIPTEPEPHELDYTTDSLPSLEVILFVNRIADCFGEFHASSIAEVIVVQVHTRD
jgi:hypothetical protein